jgi:molybdopterin converting factor small subunit
MLSYFALLRNVTRTAEETWTRPAPTLRVLLIDLVAKYGTEFARWVMPDGQNTGFAIVLVDGHDARSLQGLDTPLTPQSEICIFPPVAGG